MKIVKKVLIAIASTATLLAPLSLGAVAHAQEVAPPLQCNWTGGSEFPSGNCDLSVKKEVSVNGGAYFDANTSADAVSVTVGDKVTWKVTVENASTGNQVPKGFVYLTDLFPSNVTFNSFTASNGDFGNYVATDNVWYLPLGISDGNEGSMSALPATLVLTTTANASGLAKNNISFTGYDPGNLDGSVAYSDDVSTNNSDDAWISSSGKPAVLGDTTTLTNTGSGTTESIIAAGLIIATGAVVFLGRPRKNQI